MKIEYRENAGPAAFTLGWSSPSQPYEVVPSYRMFPSVQPIAGSPFAVTPTGRKPMDVQGLNLTVASWNSLAVSFNAPADDGGSDVVAYQVSDGGTIVFALKVISIHLIHAKSNKHTHSRSVTLSLPLSLR